MHVPKYYENISKNIFIILIIYYINISNIHEFSERISNKSNRIFQNFWVEFQVNQLNQL